MRESISAQRSLVERCFTNKLGPAHRLIPDGKPRRATATLRPVSTAMSRDESNSAAEDTSIEKQPLRLVSHRRANRPHIVRFLSHRRSLHVVTIGYSAGNKVSVGGVLQSEWRVFEIEPLRIHTDGVTNRCVFATGTLVEKEKAYRAQSVRFSSLSTLTFVASAGRHERSDASPS